MLTQINSYVNTGNANVDNIELVLDYTRRGLRKLSLTNMDNGSVPAIAVGSVIEVGGAILEASTEEAVSTVDPVTGVTVVDGIIYLIISGTGKTAHFTATAPVWSTSKQGWYGPSPLQNYRYIAKCYKSSSVYGYKIFLNNTGEKFTAIQANFTFTVNGLQTIETGAIDELNEISGGIITFKRGGLYLVEINFNTLGNNVQNYILAAIYKNGVEYIKTEEFNDAVAGQKGVSMTIPLDDFFKTGDYIQPYLSLGTTATGSEVGHVTVNRIL